MPRWTSSRAKDRRAQRRRGEPGQAILLRPRWRKDWRALISLASEGMACNMMLEDAGEGIDAFIQKRRPDWARGARGSAPAGERHADGAAPRRPHSTRQRPTAAFFAPRWAKPGRGERRPEALGARLGGSHAGRARGPLFEVQRGLRDISAGVLRAGDSLFRLAEALPAHPRPAFPDRNARGPRPLHCAAGRPRPLCRFASVAMDAIGRQFVYRGDHRRRAEARRARMRAHRPAARFSFDMLGEGRAHRSRCRPQFSAL